MFIIRLLVVHAAALMDSCPSVGLHFSRINVSLDRERERERERERDRDSRVGLHYLFTAIHGRC